MSGRTFALVDCNNFYASCEKLFDPTLDGKPLVVLSNNDGCVVARSAEARSIGVPMGAPWFKLSEMAKQHGIVARSSNYALYADMSNRVIEVLNAFTPDLEVYSIDESFLDLAAFRHRDLIEYGQQIRERVGRWLGLPVCVGIAPTKTLAKLANHIAKKRAGFNSVCDLERLPETERARIFSEIAVGEVWGVGRRIEARLADMGIETVEALRRADPGHIRAHFSVVLERTVRELNGVSCLALEEVTPPKQQIMSSRSFGTLVSHVDELREAIASYTSRAAEKLRAQGCEAGALSVMIRTNPFKPETPQYQRSVTVPIYPPTADTRLLVRCASKVLARIYRPGFGYHKAGIMLTELVPRGSAPADLFTDHVSTQRSEALMLAMDQINGRWGRGTLKTLATGINHGWRMRREWLSPSYTTDWAELPLVNARPPRSTLPS